MRPNHTTPMFRGIAATNARIVRALLMSCALASAGAALADEPPLAASAPVEEAKFDIMEFRVLGNTLLGVTDIERVLLKLTGPGKTGADVDAARGALEQRYRDAGYPTVLVNVPEQAVAEGIVRLQVVEGKVEQLSIKGSRYFSLEWIRKQVPGLAKGAILYLPEVQNQLGRLNAETGDRGVTPVLRPGRVPGTVEAELRVAEELPLHGDVELNNRYSGNTTKSRLSAGLRYDNVWQRRHSFGFNYQTAPEKTAESSVWSGTYMARFAATDAILVVYGVQSDSETAALGDVDVFGKGRIIGVRGIVPLDASTQGSRSVTLGFDYKDFDENLTAHGADISKTPIKYVSWLGQYGGGDRGEKYSTQWSFGTVFGIRGVENSTREFADKRSGGKANFVILKSDVDFHRSAIANSAVRAHATAQLSDSPLISNEQFNAGGADTVRGYKESAALGDYGAVASLEWSTPSFGANIAEPVRDLHGLFFIDGAALYVREAPPGQERRTELYSAGIGLRLSAWKTLTLDTDLAMALKAAGDTGENEWRVHGRIAYSF